ncbi:hypothetical protein SAMN05216338_101828 [Bradyrhizobium sp. Rc2d]|nr:hypothetical protein SAMN05216338_101828 [Bradyrhizobium sp. Rc2d]
MTEQGALPSSSKCHCHSPPPGLAFGEPDDRLRRGIQYVAASRFNHKYLGVLDRPVEPGDDSEFVACACHRLVIASASEAIQNPSAARFWIASSQGLLAMTEQRGNGVVLQFASALQTRLRILATDFARALLDLSPP